MAIKISSNLTLSLKNVKLQSPSQTGPVDPVEAQYLLTTEIGEWYLGEAGEGGGEV